MLKRISWVENTIFSVKLRDDLFTLAQMRINHITQFFDIRSPDGKWDCIDLNEKPSLFFAFVAEHRLKPLLVEKVDKFKVIPSQVTIPKLMLDAVIGNGVYGANLVKLTPDYSSYGAQVVKDGISAEKDLDLIHRYELTGMLGDADKLKERLIRFFDTGVSWDDAKSFLFKGITLPPCSRQ